MPIGRRLSTLLLALALVGAPAVVLRIFCVGNSCDAGGTEAQSAVPFCRLQRELRRPIASGFREGRSPDVMAATTGLEAVRTGFGERIRVSWPGSSRTGSPSATASLPDARVPIVFFGEGVERTALPEGARLDAIAPTLEGITGFHRDHPDVRTGEGVDGVATARDEATPLVVLIAWKGLGTPDLEAAPEAWPFLVSALRRGAGTIDGQTGSLPLDPAATLTTIGTGGLPSAHGITGTLVRDDDGDVQRAWSTPRAGSVIATFADDVDHHAHGRAGVAGVLTDPADRGIIGNGWYLDAVDRDTVTETAREPRHAAVVSRAIVTSEGFGRDDVTDVLGVVLDGSVREADAETADIVTTIRALVPQATFVVAGTGSLRQGDGVDAAALGAEVDETLGAQVVEGVAADGLFLDHDVLVDRTLTTQQVADALKRAQPGGRDLFDDVYPSFAVAFSRYC